MIDELVFNLDRFKEAPVLGIIRGVTLDSINCALDASVSGGLKFVELALNTENALPLIELASRQYSNVL
ncbi:uncharacterized protein METZ01_LOCUS397475, partial [marine metagenome]